MKWPTARTTLLLFALFSGIGLLFFLTYYLDDLARMSNGTMLRRFVEEMTGAYSSLALLPLIVYVGRRFPPKAALSGGLLVVVMSAGLYSLVKTTLMEIFRSLLFPLLGLGRYDYGIMAFRYPMEAAKDIISFSITYAVIYFLDRMRRGREAELAAAELEIKLAAAQFENLRLQLHPHFLFNTLNAISAVMYEDIQRADAMISKLSEFLRVVLASGGVIEVAIDQELRIEEMYVDIMTSRLERKLELQVIVAADANNAAIPFMLLQPLLENSIRHGMDPQRDGLRIRIAVSRSADLTVVEISDNGTGFEPGNRRGTGLQNVELRLKHLYGTRSSFSISKRQSGGTHVRLTFPHPIGLPA